jgi:hypothetical protein
MTLYAALVFVSLIAGLSLIIYFGWFKKPNWLSRTFFEGLIRCFALVVFCMTWLIVSLSTTHNSFFVNPEPPAHATANKPRERYWIVITGSNSYTIPPKFFTKWDVKGELAWFCQEFWDVEHVVPLTTPQGLTRYVKYHIQVERYTTPDEFVRYHNATDLHTIDFVVSGLYELTEKKQAELAKFYNPVDRGQQAEMVEVVTSFLAPTFASAGVKIRSVRFSL